VDFDKVGNGINIVQTSSWAKYGIWKRWLYCKEFKLESQHSSIM